MTVLKENCHFSKFYHFGIIKVSNVGTDYKYEKVKLDDLLNRCMQKIPFKSSKGPENLVNLPC